MSESAASNPIPPESALTEKLYAILRSSDLDTVTPKSLRKALELAFHCDLEEKKAWVKEEIGRIFEAVLAEKEKEKTAEKDAAEEDEASGDDDGDDGLSQEERDRLLAASLQEEEGRRPRRSAASESFKRAEKRKIKEEMKDSDEAKPKKSKKPPKLMVLSPALTDLLGVNELSRGDVVRRMWEYIRANQLQKEGDKRVILLDDKMKLVFGDRKSVNMFQMNQLLQKHIMKPEEVA